MSILRRIVDFLRAEPRSTPTDAPTLRNRRGGIAMIRVPESDPVSVLNGHYVVTEHADATGQWSVSPEQFANFDFPVRDVDGRLFFAGTRVQICTFHDAHLVPMPDTGLTQEEVDQLYAPGTVLIPLKVRGEVH